MTVALLLCAVLLPARAAGAAEVGAPAAPTIVRNATAGDGQATVSWTAPADDGGSPVTGYVVTPYIGFFPLAPVTFGATATTQTVLGLRNGTTYRFRVQAVNALGTSDYSTVTNPVTPRPDFFVVFDGQSLNLFGGYPWRLMAEHPGVGWANVAIAGTSWTALATTAATRTHPYATAGQTTILIMNGGTADLIHEQDDGATLYADERSYAEAARAAGFDVVIVTTTTPARGFTAEQDAARRDANALVVANADGAFDATVDFDVDLSPALSLHDASDAAAYFDGVHWSDAAATVAAALVDVALSTFLPAVAVPRKPVTAYTGPFPLTSRRVTSTTTTLGGTGLASGTTYRL